MDLLSSPQPTSDRSIAKRVCSKAKELGHNNSTASNGWLEAFNIFNKRDNIQFSILNGESCEVSADTADRKVRL